MTPLPHAPKQSWLTPRFPLWAVYVGALLIATGAVLAWWPLPALDHTAQFTLGTLAAATLAADVFTVDFPDRKRISGSYIFPLLAADVVAPAAGVLAAGAAGMASGVLRREQVRSAVFHGPRLALAAAGAGALVVAVLGQLQLALSWPSAAGVVLYMAAYTAIAWGLGRAEEAIAGKPADYASTDWLTNTLLAPLPLVLGVVYERTSLNGLVLSSLALALLLIVVRAYVNLATLHGELEQTYTRLSEQERRLEGALETNREMAQVVSHDLRGPLTSVMGYTELLRGAVDQPEPDLAKQRRYINSIEGNSRRILSLADKLLDLHRLEEGGEIELATLDAAAIAKQVVEDARIRAEQNHVLLSLDVAGNTPSLHSSEWMVREITENLLSNAIKYSRPGGQVVVRLAAEPESLLLEVEDNGIGMSAEDQTRLFTKYFRSGNEQVRQVTGTGLGLALVHTMVEQLHGRIEVSSKLGLGSRFSVHLPLTVAD